MQNTYNYTENDRERFWSKVNKKGPSPATDLAAGPCWPWTGGLKNGQKENADHTRDYGRTKINGRMIPAHRAAYEMEKGPIPEGMDVGHLCNHPLCVNPSHLVPQSRAENMKQASKLGRDDPAKWQQPLRDEETQERRLLHIMAGLRSGRTQRAMQEDLGVRMATVERRVREIKENCSHDELSEMHESNKASRAFLKSMEKADAYLARRKEERASRS